MAISEPSTLLTDYLLGGLGTVLGWRLFRQSQGHPQRAVRWFAAALMATAVGSFTGGTYHGFGPAMAPSVAATTWTATMLAMGVASFFLLASVVSSAFSGTARRALLGATAVKLGLYSWWVSNHDAFVYVICEYGSTLLFVLVLLGANRLRGEAGHRSYLACGVFFSIVAAALQQSGIRLHTHFNHNDLMHVVQMGAMWLLYQGGRRLQDANGRG